MDKNAYTMAKFGLESRDNLMSKKDCGFYVKYIFLFTSIIQFLIILGLVLFMIYGNAHAGTDTHLQHLKSQAQELYSKVTELNEKNRNLTLQLNATAKEKLACLQMRMGIQKELEKCNASLRACGGKELQHQTVFDYAVVLRMTLDDCQRNMNLLNLTCYAEKLGLQEARDRLQREAQQQRDNCSQALQALRREATTCGLDREQYRLDIINLREQHNRQLESQGRCCSLGEKVAQEITATRQLLKTSLEKPMSYQPGCHDLSQTMDSQLQKLRDMVQKEIQMEATTHAQVLGEKLTCEGNLQQCRHQSGLETQNFQKQLQSLQASCDAETKRNIEERRALTEEKGRLSQQLLEWNKVLAQAEDTRAQLESCRKSMVVPGNPGLRIPGIGSPPIFRIPSGARTPNVFANPGLLGNPGTFGNLDRASLEAWKLRVLEEAKQPNQFPRKPLEQPSG